MIHRAPASSALCIITSVRRVSSEEASQCRRYASSRHSRPILAVGVTLVAGHEQSRCPPVYDGCGGNGSQIGLLRQKGLDALEKLFLHGVRNEGCKDNNNKKVWRQVLKKVI